MTIARISLDGHWQAAEKLALPDTISGWMLEPASLTARLKRHCRTFRVQLLNSHAQPLPSFLQPMLPDTTKAQLREVILWCDEVPCVYAQSWMPYHTINTLTPLANLGERALGDYIFQQPSLQRGNIEAARLEVALSELLPTAFLPQENTAHCFARRSVFTLEGLPLLVAEVFLPAILQLKVITE